MLVTLSGIVILVKLIQFKNEEIKDYYTNWKTLMFENKKFHDEHENGIKHLHAMNKLVVKKIG